MFLTEKRDSTIKGWVVADGSTQRSYMRKEEASSPLVATKSLLLSRAIDTRQIITSWPWLSRAHLLNMTCEKLLIASKLC